MNISRRELIKRAALVTGGAMFAPTIAPLAGAAAENTPATIGGPKRFIFFNASNGLEPKHLRPDELDEAHRDARAATKRIDVPFGDYSLPPWMKPLEDIREHLSVVAGLFGYHIWPEHGAKFGFLAGTKKAVVPRFKTIDYALAETMPKTPMNMIGFAMSQLDLMKRKPVTTAASAAGDGKAVPEFADPRLAYQSLFGCAAGGTSAEGFATETEWFDQTIHQAGMIRKRLSGDESHRFDLYLDGLRRTRQQRIDLLAMKDTLAANLPKFGDELQNPKTDRQWHEVQLDIGIAALKAGITNVVTFDGGGGGPDWSPLSGFDFDMGRVQNSHYLGHMNQVKDPEWMTFRHWSLGLVRKIVEDLRKTPEPDGKGTMFDNTLIVYASDCGETQHAIGFEWPFLLIGNLGGRIRAGRYLQYPVQGSGITTGPKQRARPEGGRSVNALWATLLHAAGKPVDHFNLAGQEHIDRKGPLEALLA